LFPCHNKIVERPMMLYSSVSPKLRIQTEKPAFAGKEGNSLGKEKELALYLKKNVA
jgi:hypothetical protein